MAPETHFVRPMGVTQAQPKQEERPPDVGWFPQASRTVPKQSPQEQDILSSLTSLVRNHPIPALCAGVALGFLIGWAIHGSEMNMRQLAAASE